MESLSRRYKNFLTRHPHNFRPGLFQISGTISIFIVKNFDEVMKAFKPSLNLQVETPLKSQYKRDDNQWSKVVHYFRNGANHTEDVEGVFGVKEPLFLQYISGPVAFSFSNSGETFSIVDIGKYCDSCQNNSERKHCKLCGINLDKQIRCPLCKNKCKKCHSEDQPTLCIPERCVQHRNCSIPIQLCLKSVAITETFEKLQFGFVTYTREFVL